MILFNLNNLGKIEEAVFLERPNRFKAVCLKNGKKVSCHVADPGRLKEIFIRGRRVFVVKNKPFLKTDYKLIAVNVDNELVLLNTSIHSKIGEEAIKKGVLGFIPEKIKKEVKFGKSRIDYLINDRYFVELKGSNLLIDNKCLFPDAPTKRGEKHLKELIKSKEEGYEAIILFMAVRKCKCFYPFKEMDKQFFDTFFESLSKGVIFKGFKVEIDKNFNVLLKDELKLCRD
jgi:sugar fermentation stimulation protein A